MRVSNFTAHFIFTLLSLTTPTFTSTSSHPKEKKHLLYFVFSKPNSACSPACWLRNTHEHNRSPPHNFPVHFLGHITPNTLPGHFHGQYPNPPTAWHHQHTPLPPKSPRHFLRKPGLAKTKSVSPSYALKHWTYSRRTAASCFIHIFPRNILIFVSPLKDDSSDGRAVAL